MTELLNHLLCEAQAIRPDVMFVTCENFSDGCCDSGKCLFWAHTGHSALHAYTPDELLAGLRKSLDTQEAA